MKCLIATIFTRPGVNLGDGGPGSAQAATARWSSIVFVILFVAFSLYSVSNDLNKMPPNYYQLLGVDKEASRYAALSANGELF